MPDNWEHISAPVARVIENIAEAPSAPVRITRKAIVGCTAAAMRVPLEDVLGQRRDTRFVHARFAAAYLIREFDPDASLPAIGKSLGDRDHTTIICALRRAKELIARDADFAKSVEAARRRVLSWRPTDAVAAPKVVLAPKAAPDQENPPAAKFEPPKAAPHKAGEPVEVIAMREAVTRGTIAMARAMSRERAA